MIGPKRGEEERAPSPGLRGGARAAGAGVRSPAHTWAAGRGSSAPAWFPRLGASTSRSAQVPRERIPPPALCWDQGAPAPAVCPGRWRRLQPRGASLAALPCGQRAAAGPADLLEPGWAPRPHRAAHRRAFADRAPGRRGDPRRASRPPSRGRGCGSSGPRPLGHLKSGAPAYSDIAYGDPKFLAATPQGQRHRHVSSAPGAGVRAGGGVKAGDRDTSSLKLGRAARAGGAVWEVHGILSLALSPYLLCPAAPSAGLRRRDPTRAAEGAGGGGGVRRGRWSGEGPHLPVEGPRAAPSSLDATHSHPSVPPLPICPRPQWPSTGDLTGRQPRRLSDINPSSAAQILGGGRGD